MSFKCTGSWLTILCTNSSNPNPAKIKKKNNLPLSQSQWHCSKSISKAALDVLNLGAIYHTHKLEWFEINSVNCLPLVILIFSSRFPPKSEKNFFSPSFTIDKFKSNHKSMEASFKSVPWGNKNSHWRQWDCATFDIQFRSFSSHSQHPSI